MLVSVAVSAPLWGLPRAPPPTLPWAPPAATVEMDKGKGAKGKGGNSRKRTGWTRHVGTRNYLKNFRKWVAIPVAAGLA